MHFNNSVEKEIFENLLVAGLDEGIAFKASKILAKDDPSKENLGRSEQDRKTIQIAWQQLWQLN